MKLVTRTATREVPFGDVNEVYQEMERIIKLMMNVAVLPHARTDENCTSLEWIYRDMTELSNQA
jgi:hypothetical protein